MEANNTPTIKAIVEGTTANRKNHNGYEIAQWPVLQVGQRVTIQSHDHWLYTAKIETAEADSFTFATISREPMPRPAVDSAWYSAPNVIGDAWRISAAKGDLIRLHGRPYKVADVKPNGALANQFKLVEVTEDAWAKRPGRVSITEPEHEFAVGRVFEVGGEFLLAERVERQLVRSASINGYNYYAVGKFVDAAKAAKAKAKWEKAEAGRIAVAEAERQRQERAGF